MHIPMPSLIRLCSRRLRIFVDYIALIFRGRRFVWSQLLHGKSRVLDILLRVSSDSKLTEDALVELLMDVLADGRHCPPAMADTGKHVYIFPPKLKTSWCAVLWDPAHMHVRYVFRLNKNYAEIRLLVSCVLFIIVVEIVVVVRRLTEWTNRKTFDSFA